MDQTVPNAVVNAGLNNEYDARVVNIAVTLLQNGRKEVSPLEVASEMGLKVSSWRWIIISLNKGVQFKILKRAYLRFPTGFDLPIYMLP